MFYHDRDFKEPDNGPLSQPGPRTNHAEEKMEKHGWITEKRGNRKYLTWDGQQYLSLNGTITDFVSEPILSIGAGITREKIRLNPNSPILQNQYQLLLKKIGNIRDLHSILNITTLFVHTALGGMGDNLALDRTETVCQNPKNHIGSHGGAPIINLDKFIELNAGVCRHRGLFNAYLLNRLINDGIIAPGRTYVQRGNMEFAHTWAMYKPFRSPKLYLIDSMWDTRAHDVSDTQQLKALKYPDETIKTIETKYFKIKPFSHLTKDADKVKFIQNLLDAKTEERRKILNEQYAAGSLSSTYEFLIHKKNNYNKNPNYQMVLKDIAITNITEQLHTHHYGEINDKNPTKQTQYIAGLLTKYGKERRAILKKHSLAHLNLLLAALEDNSRADQKPYFEKFKNYPALINEIKLEKLCSPYSALPIQNNPDLRQKFILDLLEHKEYEQKLILSRQKIVDLNSLRDSLTREVETRAILYRKNPNYTTLLKEIRTMIHKATHDADIEKLCKPYSEIPCAKANQPDLRQKFTLDLLKHETHDRRFILSQQDMFDLEALQSSLKKERPDRAILYRTKSSFNALLSETANELKNKKNEFIDRFKIMNEDSMRDMCHYRYNTLPMLETIHQTILTAGQQIPVAKRKALETHLDNTTRWSDSRVSKLRRILSIIKHTVANKLKTKSSCWGCCFWTAGNAIYVDGERKYVPKKASEMYNRIPNDLELYNKSLSELEKIFAYVKEKAVAGSHVSSYRDDNTYRLYNLIATPKSKADLLGVLEWFSHRDEEASPNANARRNGYNLMG